MTQIAEGRATKLPRFACCAADYTVASFLTLAGSKLCPGVHCVTYPHTAEAATE